MNIFSPDTVARYLCRTVLPAISGRTFMTTLFVRNYYSDEEREYEKAKKELEKTK